VGEVVRHRHGDHRPSASPLEQGPDRWSARPELAAGHMSRSGAYVGGFRPTSELIVTFMADWASFAAVEGALRCYGRPQFYEPDGKAALEVPRHPPEQMANCELCSNRWDNFGRNRNHQPIDP
jgi:hypothetical protein